MQYDSSELGFTNYGDFEEFGGYGAAGMVPTMEELESGSPCTTPTGDKKFTIPANTTTDAEEEEVKKIEE